MLAGGTSKNGDAIPELFEGLNEPFGPGLDSGEMGKGGITIGWFAGVMFAKGTSPNGTTEAAAVAPPTVGGCPTAKPRVACVRNSSPLRISASVGTFTSGES